MDHLITPTTSACSNGVRQVLDACVAHTDCGPGLYSGNRPSLGRTSLSAPKAKPATGRRCSSANSPRASLLRRWSPGDLHPSNCVLPNLRDRAGSRGGRERKWIAENAASGHPLEPEHENRGDSQDYMESVRSAAEVLYRFLRLYAMTGLVIAIVSVSLLAVENAADISLAFFTGTVEAVVAAFAMQIYSAGLNQLYDIEIDKVNKPYLPLASGEYSFGTGVLITSTSALLSFFIAWISGSWPLFWTLFATFVLNSGYSVNLPFLRWKSSAVTAAMFTVAAIGLTLPVGFFLHIQTHVFRRPAILPKAITFTIAFMSIFSVVISLYKDIPDLEGDKAFGIRSLTARLGQKRVFWICIALLEMAYTAAIMFALQFSNLWFKAAMVIGHAILAFILWIRARTVDLGSNAAIHSFYMFIWKLYYMEYLLIHLIR